MARIAGVDLPRNKRLEIALTYIYGVGPARAKNLLEVTGLDGNMRTHELGDEDVVYVLSEPPDPWTGETGFVDAAIMDRAFTSEDYRSWVFVMCGPGVMMDIVEDHLIARGTPSDRILSERFDYD